MELIAFLQVLLRRKWLILIVVSLAMLTTYLIARKSPQLYAAQGQLATGIIQGNTTIFSLERGQEGLQKHEIEARFKHMAETMQTPEVLILLGYNLMLHDLEKTEAFRDLNVVRSEFSSDELKVAQRRLRLKRDSLEMLRSNDELEQKHLHMLRLMNYDPSSLKTGLAVQRIPGTDYLLIEYRSENPYLSAFAVNQLAQEFMRYHTHKRAEVSEASLETLSKVVADKKKTLDDKLKAWERIQANAGTPAVNTAGSARTLLTRIERLENARERAGVDIFAANRSRQEAEEGLKEADRAPYLSANESRGGDNAMVLRNSLERLVNRYVRGGLNNSRLLDSIDKVQLDLEESLYQAAAARSGAPDALTQRMIRQKAEAEINEEIARKKISSIDQELRRIGTQPENYQASADNSPLSREVNQAKDAYLLALENLEAARLSADGVDLNWPNISQLEYVQAPDKPLPNQAWLLTALAGLTALGISIGLFFLLEYLDRSIKTPQRFEKLTGLGLVGALNKLKSGNLDLVGMFSNEQASPELENYKQLLRKIRHEIAKEGPRTLLITSTNEGVGKTSLLVSLAYSLSLNQRKVLLIDTNFKAASLTESTGASPALEDFMAKKLSRKALISRSVFEGVDVIGCKGSNYSPSEIFKGKEFENLLIELTDQYDHIIMEGPALNDYADTQELSEYAAKIIPVFSAEDRLEEIDQQSIDYLKGLEGQLMGAVLNKVDMQYFGR